MATTFTMFFSVAPVYQDGQSYRVAGFSESWFHGSEALSSVRDDANKLMTARAKLLPKEGSIVAQRYQIVPADGKPGASSVRLAYYKGNANYGTDIPNMAYQFRALANGKQNRAIRQIKGFPDEFVVQGEAKLTAAYTRDLNTYFKALSDTWMFRGIKMDVETKEIDTIGADGLIKTTEDFACPPVGRKIQIVRTKQDEGRDDYHGQICKVESITGPRLFTAQDWDGGSCTGGRVRAWSHDFFAIDPNIYPEAVFSHKVGAPFFQYRGRASNRA